MTTSAIVPFDPKVNAILLHGLARAGDKDRYSRLDQFVTWLDENGGQWHNPDLAGFRDYLLHEKDNRLTPDKPGMAPASASAYLSTIRGRYQVLLRSNAVRQALYDLAPDSASGADKKAFVDELLTRMQNAVHPSTAAVPTITKQDVSDREHLRLTKAQANKLLKAPGERNPINGENLTGVRDTALIALALCTGLREAELCALNVDDLRHKMGGELSVIVREGKGGKQRLVPYGDLDWCLTYVDLWLTRAGITSGAVFRGLYKGSKSARPGRLTTRAVISLVGSYPVVIDGKARTVKPHDLRRTYARRVYEKGMDMERIRQNLGHANLTTTQRYIGTLDANQRRPPTDVYEAPWPVEHLTTAPLTA